MNIKNCRSCGKIFNYVSGPYTCQACRDLMEQKFQEVKEYIRENRGAAIQQVAEACDVDVAQIRQWLREDRLEVTEDSPIQMSCEGCGAPIRSGRFCDKCKAGAANGFQNVLNDDKAVKAQKRAAEEQQGKSSAKMRYL